MPPAAPPPTKHGHIPKPDLNRNQASPRPDVEHGDPSWLADAPTPQLEAYVVIDDIDQASDISSLPVGKSAHFLTNSIKSAPYPDIKKTKSAMEETAEDSTEGSRGRKTGFCGSLTSRYTPVVIAGLTAGFVIGAILVVILVILVIMNTGANSSNNASAVPAFEEDLPFFSSPSTGSPGPEPISEVITPATNMETELDLPEEQEQVEDPTLAPLPVLAIQTEAPTPAPVVPLPPPVATPTPTPTPTPFPTPAPIPAEDKDETTDGATLVLTGFAEMTTPSPSPDDTTSAALPATAQVVFTVDFTLDEVVPIPSATDTQQMDLALIQEYYAAITSKGIVIRRQDWISSQHRELRDGWSQQVTVEYIFDDTNNLPIMEEVASGLDEFSINKYANRVRKMVSTFARPSHISFDYDILEFYSK